MAEHRWHALPAADVLDRLAADAHNGLSPEQVRRRQAEFGPNDLPQADRPSAAALFLKQFQDFMIVVLIVAAAVSALLGEWPDAAAVAAIVLLNGLLGFVQEYRAERSLEALKDLTAPSARVVREGREATVPAAELVPGDIVLLFDGDRVPADGRLLEAQALAVDESVLTGESTPATKSASALHRPETAPGDRKNMVFKGTAVVRGHGVMVVTATGVHSEIGRIAGMMRQLEREPTPLQRRLAQLGRWLVVGCVGVVAAVFALGVLQGLPVYRMFLTAVSLAVAAIPEGLPAVVTVSLALGVQQMLRRRAIVRRLSAVETLGCATVICADKTGTLTRNEMTVTRVWTPATDLTVTGEGYRVHGQFLSGGRTVKPLSDPDLALALRIGALCNNARLQPHPSEPDEWMALGDPTEAALLVLAAKAGLKGRPRQGEIVGELPFDSYRKRMSVLVRERGRFVVMAKGAPDLLLARCTHVQRAGRVQPLTAGERRRIVRAVEEMTKQALRVLALAYREHGAAGGGRKLAEEEWERDLVFVGLVGMMDPPREEAKRALRVAERAGIRTIMVTGDHPHTAAAVAVQLGLTAPGDPVATGAMLDQWSDDELALQLRRTAVFARVAPNHKLRIVQTLRRMGEVVAMTGDGVNDAPAVKEADIGVAMGRTGTDVTREASDMVLADDNYATIVATVEEGRAIYDNIRKFIRYLLGCNVGEVLTMLSATLAGLPLPLLPMQILWMNLVTDGLPAVALGLDRPAPDTMKRPPRPPGESIFAGGLHVHVAVRGTIIAACTLLAFVIALNGGDAAYARTMAFTTLVALQLVYVFQCRRGAAGAGVPPNYYLLAAVGASWGMQLAVLYVPVLQNVFGVVPLAPFDWLFIGWVAGMYVGVDAAARKTRAGLQRRLSVVRA